MEFKSQNNLLITIMFTEMFVNILEKNTKDLQCNLNYLKM